MNLKNATFLTEVIVSGKMIVRNSIMTKSVTTLPVMKTNVKCKFGFRCRFNMKDKCLFSHDTSAHDDQ